MSNRLLRKNKELDLKLLMTSELHYKLQCERQCVDERIDKIDQMDRPRAQIESQNSQLFFDKIKGKSKGERAVFQANDARITLDINEKKRRTWTQTL